MNPNRGRKLDDDVYFVAADGGSVRLMCARCSAELARWTGELFGTLTDALAVVDAHANAHHRRGFAAKKA